MAPDLRPWVAPARQLHALVLVGLVAVNVANAYAIARQPWIDRDYIWLLLDNEDNPSTWLASMLLFSGALVAMACSVVDVGRRRFWLGASVVLAAASMEEIAAAHERLDRVLGSVHAPEGSRILGWVIPGTVLAAVLAGLAWRLRPRLPSAVRRLLLVGTLLYLGGAVGVEILGAVWADRHGELNAGYLWLTTVEENLEMVGSLVVLRGLARHAIEPVT